MAKFRYEIYETDVSNPYSLPINIRDVYPIDDAEFIVTETREKGQFYYVKSIKNKLKLGRDDYGHYYAQINYCRKYYVNIYKDCQGVETFIYQCYFNQTNIDYNLDKCFCEIELKDTSIYNCFNDARSIETNVMEYNSPTTPPLPANFKYDNTDPNNYRTMELIYVVSWVLGQMVCGAYEVISDFFNWQYDAFGNYIPITTQPVVNYVNVAQPGYWIWIAQKSDFINPNATNPARNMPFSFDMVEKIMTEVFNVYWVIDTGRIRFEHYSWFTKNLNYDTTTATNFPLNEFKNKLKRDSEDYPTKEIWKFMEAGTNEDFIGVPIIYDANCVGKTPKDRGAEFATTDINYILNNPGAISNDGIVILDVYEVAGQMYPYVVNGYISGNPARNMRLSIANMQYDLHRHNRPFTSGTMNNLPETFLSPVYNKIQDDMLTKLCCTDDYEKSDSLVRTEIGDGIIEEAEVNFTKEQIKFKLKHV